MTALRPSIARVGAVVLWLTVPALGATLPAVDNAAGPDSNPGLDVTRHAMPPPDVTAKPPETPAVSANPLWAIPLSTLSATRSRPLFTPSRRPPAPIVINAPAPVAVRPPPPPPPAVAEHPNFVLVGTVAGENDSVAVFIDNATRDAVRLRTGEGHSGWVLQSIDRRTATLQKGGQSETLELPKPGVALGTASSAPAPMISPLPPPPPPPQSAAPAPARAPGDTQQPGQGCMPEPIGC
jgi:general secretion pathway protein N